MVISLLILERGPKTPESGSEAEHAAAPGGVRKPAGDLCAKFNVNSIAHACCPPAASVKLPTLSPRQ